VICKVRDALMTRYVAAVQEADTARTGSFAKAEAAEKILSDVRRELREHDAPVRLPEIHSFQGGVSSSSPLASTGNRLVCS
jgi:hypothetical protein